MDTRVLTESDVHWIVEIFCKSGDLVVNRERFCLTMGLTISQLEDIKIIVARDGLGTHGFFAIGLRKWISINKTDVTIGKLIEVLRIDGFNYVADKISEELPKREGIFSDETVYKYNPSAVWFNVPEEVTTFTGRQDEMNRLHSSVVGQNVKKIGQREITVITTLSGLGGIGKTTLAIHYAWNYFRNKFYFNVIWINAETNDAIEKSFHALARKLGLNMRDSSGLTLTLIELTSKIYEHFESTSTFFVFDNVEQLLHVKPYLPVKSPKTTRQYVLITSRNQLWNDKTDLIVLDVFREPDSVEFLRSYLQLETYVAIELAKEIARELQNLPLAIRQAGAYIKKVCSDDRLGKAHVMRVYLELLHTNSKEVLNFESDAYEKTVSSTWKITLDRTQSQNYLALRIMQIISYFNSDNIPIQLLQNIPEKLGSQNDSDIKESSVIEAVKLLSEFSMVTRDSKLNISVHRLVQKVIRSEVELMYEHTILDEAVRTVKIPLKTMASDYERNCFLHAMSVSTHIRSNHLAYYYEKFIHFLTAKQSNSTDVHIRHLIALLNESKYGEAEESFCKTRDEYWSGPNGEWNVWTELCTVKFINCVCERIVNLVAIDFGREGEVLKLSEICSKLLSGIKLSFGGLHLTHFEESSELLKSFRDNTDVHRNIQCSLVETAAQMYGILFEYSITRSNFPEVPWIFGSVIDCFAYLERWTDMLGMIESLYESSIGWTESGNGQIMSYAVNAVLEACEQICHITRRIDHATNHDVQVKLFQVTLKIYNENYKVFRKIGDYVSTLQCGLGRIECLTHLNRRNDILGVIGDMKLVVDLLMQAGTCGGECELLEITESIVAYSNHSSRKDIKADLLEFAVLNFEMIFKSFILVRKYNVFLLKTVILMLNCLTQLNQISVVKKFWKEVNAFLRSISGVALDYEFLSINNAVSQIEIDSNCTSEVFNLTEFTLQIYKFTFKFGIKLNKYELIEEGMNGILNCLAELDKRPDIISFADDLKTFLATIVEDEYFGHFIKLLDNMFKMSEHSSYQDIKMDLLKTLLHSYESIYKCGPTSLLYSDMTNSAIGKLKCLAELNETQTIMETISGISGNIIKHASLTSILDVTNYFDSILLISKHPNYSDLKNGLLEIALTHYKQIFDRCKESGHHRDISDCMKGMLNYLLELSQASLFIRYVSEEFKPLLATMPEMIKSKYHNVIQIIDRISISDLIAD